MLLKTNIQVKGLKIYCLRKLKLLNHVLPHSYYSKDLLEEYSTTFLKTLDFVVEPGEHRLLTQTVKACPRFLSVQKSILGEIQCEFLICLGLGTFSKELKLEVPCLIAHPASLMPMPDFQPIDLLYHSNNRSMLGDWEQILPITRMSRSASPQQPQLQGRNVSPPGRSLPWSDVEELDEEEEDLISQSSHHSTNKLMRPSKPLPIPQRFTTPYREFRSL
jgi:hypothetical protein